MQRTAFFMGRKVMKQQLTNMICLRNLAQSVVVDSK